jgi:protein SHQ1
MLTPHFTLSQTSTHVYVTVKVPSVRISISNHNDSSCIEIIILNQSELHFYASPYLLKLNFYPYQILDDNDEKTNTAAKYNPDDQTIVIPIEKKTVVEDDGNNFWPNLELTARLIEPTMEIPKRWLHAVVDNEEGNKVGDEDKGLDKDTDDQETATIPRMTSTTDGYGFANTFHNIFRDYCKSGLATEMLQLARFHCSQSAKDDDDNDDDNDNDDATTIVVDPDETTLLQRRQFREEQESKHDFDLERYVQDLELKFLHPQENDEGDGNDDDDYLLPLIRKYIPWWQQQQQQQQQQRIFSKSNDIDDHDDETSKLSQQLLTKMTLEGSSLSSSSVFTEEERLLLSTIPYPLIPNQIQQELDAYPIGCGLLDILLAYCYDHIMTMGEPTVESSWTISMLSPSLSWLDSPATNSVRDVCIAFLRRSVCYPYFRSLEFGMMILQQTSALINPEFVVKALLQTRQILEKSESYYLGNKLYVDPYLYWAQHEHNEGTLQKVRRELCDFTQEYEDDISTVLWSNEKRETLCEALGLEELIRFEQFMKRQQEQENNGGATASDYDDDDDDSDANDDDDDDSDGDDDGTNDSSSSSTTTSGPGSKPQPTSTISERILLDDQIGTEEECTTTDLLSSMLHLKPS